MPERPQHPPFSVEASGSVDGPTTVRVRGEIDLATAEEFSGAVRSALEAGPARVDLREVEFLDSTGVRELNTLLRESSEHGWQLTVCSQMHDAVRQVLEITGMLTLLPLEDCQSA